MTATSLPVRFNARVELLRRFDLAEGFGDECQAFDDAFFDGMFVVYADGSMHEGEPNSWPTVTLTLDLFDGNNQQVFRGESDVLVLRLTHDPERPVSVVRDGRGFRFLINE